jgi:uncharacterized membrane protein
LTAFAIPIDRLPIRRPRLVLLVILAVSVCAVTAAVIIARPAINAISYSAELRIDDVLGRPLHFAGHVVADWVRHAPRYSSQFIGRLGWLDTALPVPLLLVYLGGLMIAAILDIDRSVSVTAWQRVALAVGVGATAFAISTAVYLLMGRFEGIQGRYFHPIALAAAWIVYRVRPPRPELARWLAPATVILTTLSVAVTLAAILHRYYG